MGSNRVREDRRASGELGQQPGRQRTQVLPSPARTDLFFVARAFAASKLSKAELARRSGLTREHVTNILNGNLKNAKNGIGVDTLVALLDACGFELKMEKKR